MAFEGAKDWLNNIRTADSTGTKSNFLNNLAISGGGSGGGNMEGLGALTDALGSLGSMFDKGSSNKSANQAYAAYQDYLSNLANQMGAALEARAEKYDQKLQDMFNTAEPQYQQEANTQLPELAQLNKDILNQGTEAQRANRRQIEAALANQGVRGGQAAILENRALGETTRDLQRDINQNIYNEALNRQNSRLNYYGQKALSPWTTMSSAYGSSLVGANKALSEAQGNTYERAYANAMNNYMKAYEGQQKNKKGFNLSGAINGAATGASTGASLGGGWGAAIGGVAGGAMGAFS